MAIIQAQLSQLHGTDYIEGRILMRGQSRPVPSTLNKTHADTHANVASKNKWNCWRIVAHWEAAVDKAGKPIPIFFDQLEYVVKAAQAKGITVWINPVQQFRASSWLTQGGDGFPYHIVKNFIPNTKYTSDQYHHGAGQPVWDAFWARNRARFGLDPWLAVVNFHKQVIAKLDSYSNIIGYEIMNEPHMWQDIHYKQQGDFNTYVATELRKVTKKDILFDSDYVWGSGRYRDRQLLVPRLKGGIIYTPHLYRPSVTLAAFKAQFGHYPCGITDEKKWGGQGKLDGHKASMAKWAAAGYPVTAIIGETATQDDEIPCLASMTEAEGQFLMDALVREPKARGFGICYFSQGQAKREGNQLCDPTSGALTVYGKRFTKSINKFP